MIASLLAPQRNRAMTPIDHSKDHSEDHPEPIRPAGISTAQEFAQALSGLRQAADLTINEIADAIDVPVGTLEDYFSGRDLPPTNQRHVLDHLLKTCGVSDDATITQWHEVLGAVGKTAEPAVEEQAPYRGLGSYRTADSDWFFGRKKLTYAVISRLYHSWVHHDGPVAVVGPSGSGKSSLIAAGVVTAFAKEEFGAVGSGRWPVLTLTPGGDPVAAISKALADAADANAGEIERELRIDATRAAYFAGLAAGQAGANGIVLVVDQLEEAFTETRNEADRWTLLTAANAIATQSATGSLPAGSAADGDRGPIGAVIFGLRADFYHRALRESLLHPVLQRNQIAVGPMSEPDLREAIVEPARRAHLDIDDGLADDVVKDLTPSLIQDGELHDVGALPLLSHTMLATWEHSSGGRMTLADYRAVGRIRGSLAQTADGVIDEMDPDQQAVARRLLVELVRVTGDALYTRRRLSRADLIKQAAATSSSDRIDEVLNALVTARLVTADVDTVAITHESLVAAWPQLRAWVDADRTESFAGQRVEDAARAWLQADRDPSLLYRGATLNAARDWADDGAPPAPMVRDFLDAAGRREKHRTRRLHRVVAALCMLTLIVAVGGAYAYQQRTNALEERTEAVAQRHEAEAASAAATDERDAAISRLVASHADRLRETEPALARQLSLAAFQVSPTLEARSSLLSSSSGPTVTRLIGPDSGVHEVALSADGSRLAAVADDGSVYLWDLAGGAPTLLADTLPDVAGSAGAVVFHPSENILAVATESRIVLIDVADASSPTRFATELTGPQGDLSSMAFSPDGELLAAAGGADSVWMWDVSDPAAPVRTPRLIAASGPVTSLAFSPDATQLAAGSSAHAVYRWNVANPAKPKPIGKPLAQPSSAVTDVTFSPDGAVLAAASADEHVYRWDISRKKTRLLSPTLTGPTGRVNEVAFGPGGRSIVAAASGGTAWLWDVDTGDIRAGLPHDGLTTVAFDVGGTSVFTAGDDGVVRQWDLSGSNLRTISDSPRDIARHPDLPIMAVSGTDGDVLLWNIADPRNPVVVGDRIASPEPAHPLGGEVTLRPDGSVLAAVGTDATVWRWDITDPSSPVVLPPLRDLDAPAEHLAYSPDGGLLVAGTSDGSVALWDVTDPNDARFSGEATDLAQGLSALSVTPSGDTVAVGAADGTVQFWDVSDTSAPVAGPVVVGPEEQVVGVAFSASGDRLAALSADDAVWVWDVSDMADPSPYAVLTGGGAIYDVSFDQTGDILGAAGSSAAEHIWQLTVEPVAAEICNTSGDSITESEWAEYVAGLPYSPPC